MSDLVIAIDLGATQLRAALVDASGTILERGATLTDKVNGAEAVVAQIETLSRDVAGNRWAQVRAVGVSSVGPLDTATGITSELPNLKGFNGFPFRDRLQAQLGRPVALENDGIAAAYGEWVHGAGIGLSHLVYLTVSTGVGGGVICDGRVVRGRRGMATHLGHITLYPGGEVCGCGNPGCLEAYASGTSLVKFARRAYHAAECLPEGVASIEAIDGRSITAAARAGDPIAVGLIEREGDYLGLGLVSILHAFSPERVIIGGGVSHAFDMLMPRMRAEIERHAMPAFRDVEIVRAALGDNAGIMGAAALAHHLG